MAGRSKILEVQDCPQLHSKVEASLGHMSSCLRKGRDEEWERDRQSERPEKEKEGGGRKAEGTVEESREEREECLGKEPSREKAEKAVRMCE